LLAAASAFPWAIEIIIIAKASFFAISASYNAVVMADAAWHGKRTGGIKPIESK
jgi:hypothetical protein